MEGRKAIFRFEVMAWDKKGKFVDSIIAYEQKDIDEFREDFKGCKIRAVVE